MAPGLNPTCSPVLPLPGNIEFISCSIRPGFKLRHEAGYLLDEGWMKASGVFNLVSYGEHSRLTQPAARHERELRGDSQ